jgi:hypothetical protein
LEENLLVNPKLSVFNEPPAVKVPKDKKYIFVSDHFEDIFGNLDKSIVVLSNLNQNHGFNLKTKDLNHNLLEENRDKLFIFGGLNTLNWKFVADLITANRYCVIETELKFCKHKSPAKHKMVENTNCNCHNDQIGKVVEEFYSNAEMIFWLSEEQKNLFHEKLPKLKFTLNQTVMPQIFDQKELHTIDELIKNKNSNGKFCVLNSNNLSDGTFEAMKFGSEVQKQTALLNFQDFKTELEFLNALSNFDGIIYTPAFSGISPRFLVQAKLLGLEILTKENNNIDLFKEPWFTKNTDEIKEHIQQSTSAFNETIQNIYQSKFKNNKISGYAVFDKENIKYFDQFIDHFSPICDELLIGLFDVEASTQKENVVIHNQQVDESSSQEVFKDMLRKKAKNDFVLELSPEYVPEVNFKHKLNNILPLIPKKADFFCLPILTKGADGNYIQNKDLKYWREILSRNVDLQVKHKNKKEVDIKTNNGLVTYIDAVDGNLNIFLDFTQNVKIYDHLFYDLDINNIDNYTIFNRVCETLAYKYPTINVIG